jgi:2-oxoglutarate ferredoxin oxidoreductase subunit alpha
MYGRHGEAPLVVLCAQSPADCFFMSVEAAKIAVKYMTPVLLLTDGYLAFGSEPLKVPQLEELPEIPVHFRTDVEGFHPYTRDENFARPWAIPGTAGLEHRIGGLEKKDVFGNISYEPENHQIMVNKRKEKIDNVQKDVPDLVVEGDQDGELLVLGWGSTYGAIKEAIRHVKAQGYTASQAHIRYIHPFPKNVGEVLGHFKKVLIPELNMGQMAAVIRSTFLRDVIQFNKVQGQQFKVAEIESKIIEVLGGQNGN